MREHGRYIWWLEECSGATAAEVGNKMAGIGEMLRAGFRSPPGFVVSRWAYEACLAETGLKVVIQEHLDRAGRPDALHEAAAAVRRAIETTPLPGTIAGPVRSAYGRLLESCGGNGITVAVRSSATAEDMPDASFAGQQDTYLGVAGEEHLLRSLRQCWASLFTERALSYRAKMGYPLTDVSIAVGVQKMVNARSAGVMFTINPVTGNPFEMVIEGNWGLGESVVQSMVAPDRFLVRKSDLTITSKAVSSKIVAMVQAPGGAVTVTLPPEQRDAPCLTDAEVVELARLGRLMEDHYGAARDIEWAVDADLPFPDGVFLLQVRPVTTTGLREWHRQPGRSTTDHLVDLMLRKRFGRP